MAYLTPFRSADPDAASRPFYFWIGNDPANLGVWQPKVVSYEASVREEDK